LSANYRQNLAHKESLDAKLAGGDKGVTLGFASFFARFYDGQTVLLLLLLPL
jgi:hypothetical protein